MRHLGLFSCLCLTATAGAAEPPVPAPDYLRHHSETRGFSLGRPVKPTPSPDGQSVLFLRSGPRRPDLSLYEFDVRTGQARELLTPQQLLKGAEEHLSQEEKARRERMRISLRGFTSFDLSRDGKQILLSLSGRLYRYARQGGAVRELPTGGEPTIDPKLAPDGRKIAYVKGRDLYVLDLATGKERRLTRSQSERVTNGLAEFIAQEEMHRFSGLFWSPDSEQLAYEQADSREVETFHIADPLHPEAPPATFSYPRPGKNNARVRLGLIAAAGGKTTWIAWDSERFPYLGTVRWPEEALAPLTLTVLSRDQHDLEVLKVDPRSGQTARLLHEHDDAWLNLDQQVPRWLPDGSAFLWTTERRGGWELELRDGRGELLRVLVPREAVYRSLIDVDEKAGQVVYAAAPDPATRHLYRVPLAGGAAVPLGPAAKESGPGIEHAVFSKDHAIYVRTFTSTSIPPLDTVHRADGTLIGELPSVAERPPFRPRVELTQVGERSFRAAIIRPRNFVAGRKYPVVLSVYAGPAHQQVLAALGPYLLDQYLADHGFIIVALDGRGTPGRGREFERAILGNFARVTTEDQVAGLRALSARYPELDLSRVGVFGWSFGGYMAALLTQRHPELFKVGVAGAPVVDWLDYDTCYTERYLGLPEHNPQGYKDSSLLSYAGELQRPLLLIHGTADDNVYFFHSLKLSNALFRAGKEHDLLPLSGLTHMVPEPVVAERLWGRILDKLARALHP